MATKRNAIEDGIQGQVIGLLEVAAISDLIYFAVPNGGFRDWRTAAILKATGQLPGVGDIVFCPSRRPTHFLEIKTLTGVLSQAQRDFRDRCNELGLPYAVARSRDEAQDILTDWGFLRVRKE